MTTAIAPTPLVPPPVSPPPEDTPGPVNEPAQEMFVDLPVPSLHTLAPVSLDTFVYEGLMAKRTGLPSLAASAIEAIGEDSFDYCRRLSFAHLFEKTLEAGIYEKFPDVNRPSAMQVPDVPNLMLLATIAYQVAYANYVVMKTLHGWFPFGGCGIASHHLILALMMHGFHNATQLFNDPHDHAYVGLPFVLEKSAERGFVVVDPTSDQLWPGNGPRNAVFVTDQVVWEYVTKWRYAEGKDLFPTDTIKVHWLSKPMPDFIDHAFRNARPVGVSGTPA